MHKVTHSDEVKSARLHISHSKVVLEICTGSYVNVILFHVTQIWLLFTLRSNWAFRFYRRVADFIKMLYVKYNIDVMATTPVRNCFYIYMRIFNEKLEILISNFGV